MGISELEIALLLQIPAVLAEQMARLAKEELPKAPFVSFSYFPCFSGAYKNARWSFCGRTAFQSLALRFKSTTFAPAVFILSLPNRPRFSGSSRVVIRAAGTFMLTQKNPPWNRIMDQIKAQQIFGALISLN